MFFLIIGTNHKSLLSENVTPLNFKWQIAIDFQNEIIAIWNSYSETISSKNFKVWDSAFIMKRIIFIYKTDQAKTNDLLLVLRFLKSI